MASPATVQAGLAPSPTPSPSLARIGQIAVRVHDVDRAVAFYRDTLGVPFAFAAPPGLAFFQCGDVMLMLAQSESPEFDHPSSVLYFDVDDVRPAYESLKARGVAFRDQPHPVHRTADRELWMAFFKDTEDNTHAIRSWLPRA